MYRLIYLYVFYFIFASCQSTTGLINHEFPDPVDTESVDVFGQRKQVYDIQGVYADNEFEGARMNNFSKINNHLFRAVISPENYPINGSAYYSLRIWADTIRDIELELFYTKHEHRYIPKISYDGEHWVNMHATDFDTLKAPNIATLRLRIGPEKTWISAQELHTSKHVKEWVMDMRRNPNVHSEVIGKSKLGRPLQALDIYNLSPRNKNAIVILSRQHPPEVTGHYAMESFVEEILSDTRLSRDFLNSHRILVYPLLNPDGVDEGHWRHNAGGIDLNRDWAIYNQEETKAVAEDIVKKVNAGQNNVLVGLDFHSTQKDLYYTLSDNRQSHVYPFKDYWLQGINNVYSDYTPDDRPNDLNQPITKGWFYLQFGAEGITYEIGDETPRDFISSKGRTAARELMKLLILQEKE